MPNLYTILTHFAVLPINLELTRKLIGKHHTPNMNQITFHHIVQKIDFCWKDKHSKFPCDSTINRMTFYFLGQVYRWGHLLCSTDIQFEGHPNSRVYRFRGSMNSIKCSKYHWPEHRYLLFVCLFEFYVSGTTIMCVCVTVIRETNCHINGLRFSVIISVGDVSTE